MTLNQQVIDQLLTKFTGISTGAAARMVYKENPELFRTLESARTQVRQMRGAAGKDRRAQAKRSIGGDHFRPKKAPSFPPLPDARKLRDGWNPIFIPGPLRALIISDLHIPFHDKVAVEAAIKEAKKKGVNFILINGDLGDFFWGSDWINDPRERDFPGELKANQQFLAWLRGNFPKARIVYKLGNHEDRYERYMIKKAPELLGVPEFEFPALFHLNQHRIEYHNSVSPLRLGHLNFIHGHEYRFSISNPVGPARGIFLRAKAHTVCGHFHQINQYSDRTLEQKVITTWSVGCLCEINPKYRPLNNWQHGCMLADIDDAGAFDVKNCRIIDGVVYH